MCWSNWQAVINQRVTSAAPRLMPHVTVIVPRAGWVGGFLTEMKGLIWHSHLSLWIRCRRLRLLSKTNFTADHAQEQFTASCLSVIQSARLISQSNALQAFMVRNNMSEIVGACYAVWQSEQGQSDINPARRQTLCTQPIRIFSQSAWYLISSLPAFKKYCWVNHWNTIWTPPAVCVCVCRVCLKNASICSSLSSSSRGWSGFRCFIQDTSLTRWSLPITDLLFTSKCSQKIKLRVYWLQKSHTLLHKIEL